MTDGKSAANLPEAMAGVSTVLTVSGGLALAKPVETSNFPVASAFPAVSPLPGAELYTVDSVQEVASVADALDKLSTESLIGNLENYLSIHTVQQILRSSDLISARSWSELKVLVKTGINQNPQLKATLIGALTMQQVCDLKAISYYTVASEFVAPMVGAIKGVVVPVTSFNFFYPLRVDEQTLRADDGELKPVQVFEDEFGVGVVLTRKRIFTISEDVSSDKFNDALKQQFPDAEKIVAVKTVARQTFDAIYFNRHAGLLEMRADIMRDATTVQTSGQLAKSTTDLKNYAARLLSGLVSGLVLDAPINMYPLTTKIYEDKSGAIKRLGFVTDTDSVKRETMKAGIDLREELFHKSGADAIDHKMKIFEIAIQWHGEDVVGGVKGSRPEIHVPGTYRDFSSLNSRSDFILAKGVRTFADANFILSKINAYRS